MNLDKSEVSREFREDSVNEVVVTASGDTGSGRGRILPNGRQSGSRYVGEQYGGDGGSR
jgi:hypothetical protein